MNRPTESLRAHPLNASIYDADRDDSDLRRSIAEHGILTPLVIDQHDTILSGHRRWRVAQVNALEAVPVVVRQIDDPLDSETILIESNRQREKTASEVMREAEHIGRIEEVKAKARQRLAAEETNAKRRGEATLPPTLAEAKGETREIVAAKVGLKKSTFAKIEKVWNAAKDASKPEVQAVAQQQMARLDSGQTTVHQGWTAVQEAKAAEKVTTLPTPAPVADPFAGRPKVRAARLVKNGHKAMKATADFLLTSSPEEMVDALELIGGPDYLSPQLAQVGRWIADYQRILRHRRSGLQLVDSGGD